MHPYFPVIWNVLHDGTVDRISGAVPGDVCLHIGIEYLRECFSDEGEEIVVCLFDCSKFSYQPYDGNQLTDLAVIANMTGTILSAKMQDADCRVFTDTGVLEIQCAQVAVSLDSGRSISLDELLSTATSYWDQWETKHKPDR